MQQKQYGPFSCQTILSGILITVVAGLILAVILGQGPFANVFQLGPQPTVVAGNLPTKLSPSVTPTPPQVPASRPPNPPTPQGPTSTPLSIRSESSAISIKVYDSSELGTKGKVHFQFSAGSVPLRGVKLFIVHAKKDIVGRRTSLNDGRTTYNVDANGMFDLSLEPGDYTALGADTSGSNQLMANWGIKGSDSSGRHQEMIVFPIMAGKTTDIVVSLNKLEIGLVSAEGDAIKDNAVLVACQETDIAGKKMLDTDLCNWMVETDPTGIATFNLGPGIYGLMVGSGTDYSFYYDIALGTGQVRREIIKLPK